jgi:hypothetical protein
MIHDSASPLPTLDQAVVNLVLANGLLIEALDRIANADAVRFITQAQDMIGSSAAGLIALSIDIEFGK